MKTANLKLILFRPTAPQKVQGRTFCDQWTFAGKLNLAGIMKSQMFSTKRHHSWHFCQNEWGLKLKWRPLHADNSVVESESVVLEWQSPALAYKQQAGLDGCCCTRLNCQYARWSSSKDQRRAVRTLNPAHRGEDKQTKNSTPTCQSLDSPFLSL